MTTTPRAADASEDARRPGTCLFASLKLVPELLRLAAFTLDPAGGNPAGVWLGEDFPEAMDMQRMAASVGFSETAFVVPTAGAGPRSYRVRYFSAAAEVAFCGHATIAAGVALAERRGVGQVRFQTNDGVVLVDTARRADGHVQATLTSVRPSVRSAEPELLEPSLEALGWRLDELDPAMPPAVGYAGVSHLILTAATYERLARLEYDFDRLRSIMLAADLTTVQLIWREAEDRFRARDPFPVGNVVEDPATGAAAAAFGAYLRWLGALRPPASFRIAQGVEMGRASDILVEVPDSDGGIRVSGTAVADPLT